MFWMQFRRPKDAMSKKTLNLSISSLFFVFVLLIFLAIQISVIAQANVLSGESSILSNVVIDYVRFNIWHYPVHAHELFYPGIQQFMLHPPLHYLLSSIWIDAFGIGIWQLHFQSAITGMIGTMLATYCLNKIYDSQTAVLNVALACISAAYLYGTTEYRPDLSFGLIYSLNVLLLGMLLLTHITSTQRNIFAALLGLLSVAALATHWFGYFVQLYLVVFCLSCLKKHAYQGIAPIAHCVIGWITGMLLWYLFFGDELLISLIVILIKGNDFNATIDIPLNYALIFLTEWPGGRWLLLGLITGIVYSIFTIIQSLKQAPKLNQRQIWAVFLSVNLLAYLAFFYFFVGNKSVQYSGNILFLAFPLAAIGYGVTIKFILNSLRLKSLFPFAVASLVIIQLASSPLALKYLQTFPSIFINQHQNYDEARQAMNFMVGNGNQILLGGNTYPYLYDRNYVSTMSLVAQHLLPQPSEMNFSETITHYRGLTTTQYSGTPFPIANRMAALENIDYIALADSGHSWQNLFYDPQIWSTDFKELGILILQKAQTSRVALYPSMAPFYSYSHHFYQRKGAQIDPRLDTEYPALLIFNNGTMIVTPGQFPKHSFMSADSWKSLKQDEQIEKIHKYLDLLNWYGAKLNDTEKHDIVDALYPDILAYVTAFDGPSYNGIQMKRTLSQGIDHSFSLNGYPLSFPRVPEKEWLN
jgi:hypothetical protein